MTTTATNRLRPIPDDYHNGGMHWRFVERRGPWAIYASGSSCEVVRTTANPFPPVSDSWGADGFSFSGTGSLQRARDEIGKLLITKRRLLAISSRRPEKPRVRARRRIATPSPV